MKYNLKNTICQNLCGKKKAPEAVNFRRLMIIRFKTITSL